MFDGCCTNTEANTNNSHRHTKVVRVKTTKKERKIEKKNTHTHERRGWVTFQGVASVPRVPILACAKSIESEKNERQRQRNKPNIVSAAAESLERPLETPFTPPVYISPTRGK